MNTEKITALCFGEMLFDMLPTGKVAGGAPMNVAIHLNNLGIPTALISRVGNDANGKELLDFLQSKNVNTTLLQKADNETTGIVNVDITQSDDPQYDIVENVAWDYIDDSFLQTQNLNPKVIVYGSLACRSETSKNSLLTLLQNTQAQNVFDLNLRKPFYNTALITNLIQLSHIIKINEHEFALLKKWYHIEEEKEKKGLKALLSKFKNLHLILLTKGGNGASLLSKDQYITYKSLRVKVVDTIGSGDSFLGGFLSRYIIGKSLKKSLKFAVSTGGYVATQSGANPRYTIKDIKKLFKNLKKKP